jgi:hypothetical protein
MVEVKGIAGLESMMEEQEQPLFFIGQHGNFLLSDA